MKQMSPRARREFWVAMLFISPWVIGFTLFEFGPLGLLFALLYHWLMAASVTVLPPGLIIFFFFPKTFAQGVKHERPGHINQWSRVELAGMPDREKLCISFMEI